MKADFWLDLDSKKNDVTRLSPNANLVAGGFGGLCSLVIGYPFDTVKVRLQTNPCHKNAWECFKSIVVTEGSFSLFRGISGLAVVALPKFALMFYTNAVVRNFLIVPEDQQSRPNYGSVFLSGAMSQILVVPLIVAPLERIKVIMQTDAQVKGQLACAKHIVRSEGARGLFKGTLITYARDVPSFATYFLVYDFFRQKLKAWGLFGTVMSGSLAGIAGWTIAIPLDVIKTRHQSDPVSKSAITNALQLYKLVGFRGFFLGSGPILLRAGPANAAAFLGYEVAIKVISYLGI